MPSTTQNLLRTSSRIVLRAALWASVMVVCTTGQAIAQTPDFTESFTIAEPAKRHDHELHAACAAAFSNVLVNTGAFLMRHSPSTQRTISACVDAAGVSATAKRECELAAARSEVDVVVVLELSGDDPVRVLASATSLARAAKVWGDSESSTAGEVYAVCDLLGARFLASYAPDAAAGGSRGVTVGAGVTFDRGASIVNEVVDDTGFLTVKSEPSGATVTINGKKVGQTPYQDEVMVGRYVVVAELGALFYPMDREIVLNASGATIMFDLASRFGTLAVESTPPGASVFVDGTLAGTTPLRQERKPSGTYVVRVSKPSFLDETRSVRVDDGEEQRVVFALAANAGGLTVTSAPSGAAVSLNGKATGATTPAHFDALQPGTYEVGLALPGYGAAALKAKVREGEPTAVQATLEPQLGVVSVLAATQAGTPCEGAVFVDGASVGATPAKLELTATTHLLRVTCGEASADRTIDVVHNSKQRVDMVVAEGAGIGAYVLVRGGSFAMGSPADEGYREDDETQHQVHLSRDFYVKATEVTQGEWSGQMGTVPGDDGACPSCPVRRVSWYDALAYCNALSHSQGLVACYDLTSCSGTPGQDYTCATTPGPALSCAGYRLPTEAEWEYAARAGSTTRYASGAAESDLADGGWYVSNSEGAAHPVGLKRANAWGLYDVHGNVWEWTWDRKGALGTEPATDPTGPSTGTSRVLRGGGWFGHAGLARSASRHQLSPTMRDDYIGFRPVRTRP